MIDLMRIIENVCIFIVAALVIGLVGGFVLYGVVMYFEVNAIP